jgi:stalled ribosome alternative rescue factor ArfA
MIQKKFMLLIQKLKYNSLMALLHHYLFAGKLDRDRKPVAAFMAHHEQQKR